ncbi:MAG TPA: hypothetical protein VME43_09475 [Bryobacteraceae bacterium]|nr:hypothetical protein [Bryobacteraceae bacterium]
MDLTPSWGGDTHATSRTVRLALQCRAFAVRTKADPLRVVPTIEMAIWNLDRNLAVSGVKTMEHVN